jgi:hypothetical protein
VRLDAVRVAGRVRYLACGLATGGLVAGTVLLYSPTPASAATCDPTAYRAGVEAYLQPLAGLG